MLQKIKGLAQEIEKDVIALRRHFHQNPEIAWDEVETSKRVAEELKKIGCENIRIGFGGTQCGVSADIIGGKGGKCIALRADIDALPLQDEKDAPYRSQKAGVMHACGHDGHTAMLLGAAKILMSLKADLKGKVRLLFQPAEEHATRSGGKAMIDDGALEGVDAAFGIHVYPSLPTGQFQYRFGPFMAASARWELTLTGKGGHGSSPEMSIDPTIAAFQVGNAFQSIISREVSPRDTAVISVGGMKTSSHVFNIIPERVELNGTVRTFLPGVQDCVENAMARLSSTIAEAYRCKADFKYTRSLPSTINDEKMTALVKSTAESLFGADNVKESSLVMGSEDFSYYGQVVPASYASLGTGCAEKKVNASHHSPQFDVDESALASGVAMHALVAWNYLEGK